jgi:hypothetical protein
VHNAAVRLLTLCALWLLGCGSELSFGTLRVPDAGGDAPPGSAFCSARGPALAVTDSDPSCASQGLHHALCSCGDYVSSGTTEVDGYDSRSDAGAQGSLALAGGLSAGDVRVLGSLIIGGITGAPLTGPLDVRDLLLDRGPLQGNQLVSVGGDARIAGDVRLAGLRVGGTLRLPEAAALELADGVLPSTLRTAVQVAAPCSCSNPVDVGALIDAARSDNDNAAIGLEPQLGLRTFDSERSLALPCGRYYVAQIYAARPIALRVSGRVELYIDQRIVSEQAGGLSIELDSGAELDLFLRGGITSAGPLRIGTASTASVTRLYIAGQDSLFFAADTSIAASVYAPNSELVSQARFELFGASLVRRFVAERATLLHYDVALGAGSCAR